MIFKPYVPGLTQPRLSTTALKQLALIVITILLCGCEPVESIGEVSSVTGRSLCLEDYQICIDPIFHTNLLGSAGRATCSSSGCHDTNAGSGGGFKLNTSPALNSEEMRSNFFTAQAFANFGDPSESKLVLEPLMGSFAISGSHAGGDIIPNTVDPCYLAIIDWIDRQVNDENSSSCGQCTPPALGACGF